MIRYSETNSRVREPREETGLLINNVQRDCLAPGKTSVILDEDRLLFIGGCVEAAEAMASAMRPG